MPAEPAAVDQPKYPIHALTTFELRDYRKRLESAIASFSTKNPVPQARDQLQGARRQGSRHRRWRAGR